MRGSLITTDPFAELGEPGAVAGGDEVGACCGLLDRGHTMQCVPLAQNQCIANGALWKQGSCDLLDRAGHLDSEGRCFFRHCDTNECVDSNVLPFPCQSTWFCTPTIIGKCNTTSEQPCADELGACCKAHLGGGCEELYAQVVCEEGLGVFMGRQTTCADVTCPTDTAPTGCREYEDRVVPTGLRQWSSDVCAGVVMDVVLDDENFDNMNNAAIMSERMRLFGMPTDRDQDPCLQCQTAMSFGMDGDANAPFIGNAQNTDQMYNEHYKAWVVLDEHGLYGMKYDAILVGSFKTPPWAEFLFMSHGTFCRGPKE